MSGEANVVHIVTGDGEEGCGREAGGSGYGAKQTGTATGITETATGRLTRQMRCRERFAFSGNRRKRPILSALPLENRPQRRAIAR
jgi:hypothetical protein